jgi:transposase-like protein
MPAMARPKDGNCLSLLACPNPDCDCFNQFDAGNLSVVEFTGKNKDIRRLWCNHCGQRFSERRGSLMHNTKLPEPTVVRIIKCLGHGCSIEAAADICDVDPRTVDRMLECAGKRAEDFHNLQLQRLRERPDSIKAVELDELHGRVCKSPDKKGVPARPMRRRSILDAVAAWVGSGFTLHWK